LTYEVIMIANLYNFLTNNSTLTGWECIHYYILEKKKVLVT
jgi:hypothetical protein